MDIKKERGKTYFAGLLGALLGALVGAIPWAIAYYFGWFVGWLGFLIGFCTVKGYELFKGKNGLPKVFIVIAAIIIGVILGQLMGDFLTLWMMINKGELDWATYADIPYIYYLALTLDPDILGEILRSLALGLVFAVLGVWKMIKDMVMLYKNPPSADGGELVAIDDVSGEDEFDVQD